MIDNITVTITTPSDREDLVEEGGKTVMTQSIVFPSQEVRDVVLKGGLTAKGTSEFYDRLEALLAGGSIE